MTERKYNFTGKSDFFDWCNMHHTLEEVIKNSNIYFGDAEIKKEVPEDLIPYFTHLVSSAACDLDKQVIYLSSESWIDIEEKEHLAIDIYDVIKAARKAKKEKVEFNFDYFKNQKYYSTEIDAVYKSIIDVINQDKDIIKMHLPADYKSALRFIVVYLIPQRFNKIYDKIHDKMHNRMREDFVKYAAENGYETFIYDSDVIGNSTKGKYHPIIWQMCWAITCYKKMIEKYGDSASLSKMR